MAGRPPLALLVDFGEVISQPQPDEIVTAMASVAGVDPSHFHDRYWQNRPTYDRGASAQWFWSEVAGHDISPDGVLDELIRLDNDSWSVINEDTLRVLSDAHKRGHSLSLLSNAPHEFANVMARNPVLADFDHIIFSAWLGAIKPDPSVFQAAIAELGRPPDEILFIDDRDANVRGALEAGLRAVLFTSAEELRAELKRHDEQQ
jgi:putative hydrolase of the HAD superfamily